MIYTTVAQVADALGPSVAFATDPYAPACVDAANATVYRKRREAGYTDVDTDTPGADTVMGATLYAVALWRERQSTETFTSFDDFTTTIQTGGSWPQIKRLIGIPRARVDRALTVEEWRARRRHPAGVLW
jgi:hypothetical protein